VLCLSRHRPTIQCFKKSIIEQINLLLQFALPLLLLLLLLLFGSRVDAPGDALPLKMCPQQCGARARPSTLMILAMTFAPEKSLQLRARPANGRCRPWRRFSAASATRYRAQYANDRSMSLSPLVATTSSRMHGEFLRLCFLQAQR
jgi:hypothetical protein